MNYVVYELATWKRIRAKTGADSFSSERVAKRVLTSFLKKFGTNADAHRTLYAVDTYDNWATAEPIVDTYNMLDPDRKPVKIRLSLKGGCCDPATETYHSM